MYPLTEQEELGRLVIQRDGDAIRGLPQTERRIAPRARLSADDAAFFRRELAGVFLPTDSPWQRANKIRSWLVSSPHTVGMLGLATRVPREAYQQMRQGEAGPLWQPCRDLRCTLRGSRPNCACCRVERARARWLLRR